MKPYGLPRRWNFEYPDRADCALTGAPSKLHNLKSRSGGLFLSMRSLYYWQEKLDLARKKLEALTETLRTYPGGSEPPKYIRGFRTSTKSLQLYRKTRRLHATLVRQVKMLTTTKIPYYEKRIRDLTPSRWDRLSTD